MKTFTIENETNNITAHPTAREAKSVAGAERFATAAALAGLAAHWPPARPVEIWNSLPGVTPVKKFKDRAAAVSRIWKAIQSLASAEAPREPQRVPAIDRAPVAAETRPQPEASLAAFVAPQTSRAAAEELSKTTRASRSTKPPVAASKNVFCKGSKTETILVLLKQPGGTTLKEIMQATDWQAHSVRGFLSGTIGRKMNLTLVSTRNSEGERNYCLKA